MEEIRDCNMFFTNFSMGFKKLRQMHFDIVNTLYLATKIVSSANIAYSNVN